MLWTLMAECWSPAFRSMQSQRLIQYVLIIVFAALLSASHVQASALYALDPIPGILPWHNRTNHLVTNASERPLDGPLTLLLSKTRYYASDKHIDGVLWLDETPGKPVPGHLVFRMTDADGQTLVTERVEKIPDSRLFFSLAFPEELAGQRGRLDVVWLRPRENAHTQGDFQVRERDDVPDRGRVRIDVPNATGAWLRGVPISVGVPFARGMLNDADSLRLVDESGNVVPLQTEVLNRWSRFGGIRWLRCDFTADVAGDAATYYLEFGPDVQPHEGGAGIELTMMEEAFPRIRAGQIAVREDGVWFDAEGDGAFERVFELSALHGGFVEHEDGRRYRMVPDRNVRFEQQGDEKIVVQLQGYFMHPDSGAQFCRYNTRLIVHRDSPVLQIVHTWIFTGDGNTDRIANMGWRFEMAPAFEPEGFLESFGQSAQWRQADYLLQHDYDKHDLVRVNEVLQQGGRAPGVAAASGNHVRVVFGIRDFWQNFPSELAFEDNAFVFYNWPRHSRPAVHSPPTVDDAIRLWFVHEGEFLDFRLPEQFLSGDIYDQATRGIGYERHWEQGDAETANAQGIARTEEMWVYLVHADQPRENAVRVVEGLNEQTLRGIVDPKWMASSGAFYEIHHRDVDKYPEHEYAYEQIAKAPYRWVERVGLYGMWLYGDNLWNPYLPQRSAQLYRALRKSHHRWPYSWIPFVRSGDPQLLRYAHAATRQMYDANFCHYVSKDVEQSAGSPRVRRRGIWHQSLVPWAGRNRGPATRHYSNQMDYLWHAYYVVGDLRARDAIQLWLEEVKIEEDLDSRGPIGRSGRVRTSALHSFVEMYDATHDPWFLVASHALAERDLEDHANDRLQVHPLRDHFFWRDWRPGEREFLRLTGDPAWEQFTVEYARDRGSHHYAGWASQGQIEPNVTGWRLTGDDYFLRRLAHELDYTRQAIYDGEPEYFRGYIRAGTGAPMYTSWYLYQFPFAVAAFEEAGYEPLPIPNRFWEQGPGETEAVDGLNRQYMPRIYFEKPEGEAVPINLSVWDDGQLQYQLWGPDGELFMKDQWEAKYPDGLASARPTRDEVSLVVPSAASPGVYRLEVTLDTKTSGPGRLYVPVTPPNIREVFENDKLQFHRVGTSVEEWNQYWFKMPDTDQLKIEFTVPRRAYVRRISIWNSDWQRVWDHNMTTHDIDGQETVQVVVDVPADQQGELWRITMPGHNGSFRFQTQVPGVFSASPDRWFAPGSKR